MSETIHSFQARYEDHFTRKIAAKDRELDRARRALRVARAQITEERARARAAIEAVEALRDERRGAANQAHYVAIVAELRVKRALGGER